MNAETLFSWCGTLVLPGWLLLIVLPRWKYSAALISGLIIPGLLGVVYTWLIVSHMGSTGGGFGSLAGVRELFSNDFLPLRLSRRLGLAAVNRAPPLKRLLMRHAMGDLGHRPRLSRGLAL